MVLLAIGASAVWLSSYLLDSVMTYATASWLGQHYYTAYAVLQSVVSACTTATVVLLGVELRRSLVPRLGVVLIVLGLLGLAAAVTLGVPPVLGLLLGAILGVHLIRRAAWAARSAT